MMQTKDYQGPIYIRLGKGFDPIVSEESLECKIGKNILIAEGADIVFVTTGITLKLAIQARANLKESNINAGIIHCHTLKPFDEDYVKLGKKLNWLLEGGLVKFVIPFEAYHIDNKEYIDKIRKRIKITLDNMPDVTHTKTYLIANYEATSIYDRIEKKNLTEELLLKTHESDLLKGFDVGFNLAHSRLDLQKPENAKKLYDSVIKLKNYYVNAKQKYGDRIDVYDIMPHEGTDWDIFYKSGKLYLTPFLLEAVTSFDEEFEVKKDWNFEGLYETYLESFLNQVDWAHKNKDCQNCQFVSMCAERGVHSIMKLIKTTNCISPLKSLEDKIIWR